MRIFQKGGFFFFLFLDREKDIAMHQKAHGLLALHNCAQGVSQLKLVFFHGTPLPHIDLLVGLLHVYFNVYFCIKGE